MGFLCHPNVIYKLLLDFFFFFFFRIRSELKRSGTWKLAYNEIFSQRTIDRDNKRLPVPAVVMAPNSTLPLTPR